MAIRGSRKVPAGIGEDGGEVGEIATDARTGVALTKIVAVSK